MTRSRRICTALLLAAALLVPWAASAAPRSPAEIRTASPALLPRLWSPLTAFWVDLGCLIDPSGGGCGGTQGTTPNSPLVPDLGCGLDPSGGCQGGTQSTAPASPAFPDLGCGVDPSGSCGTSH
jgi:hypothetical protein